MAMSIGSTGGYFGAPPSPAVSATAGAPAAPDPSTAGRDALALSGSQVTGTVRAAMTGADVSGAPAFETKAVGAIRGMQGVLASWVNKIHPVQPSIQGVQVPQTLMEKVKAVGKAALFFAIPVGGAAAVACGLGWLIGPLVPVVGGHVFGAILGSLAVGETTGFLLHGVMRMSLISSPAQADVNSAGATVGSAAIGVGLAGAIALAAGAPITLPILGLGALLGAAPRALEWLLAKH